MPALRYSVAPERNVYIIPEPAAQRNMPSAPEFSNTFRYVRIIKIHTELKSKHLSKSHCHIRITTEIKINLKHIGKSTKPCTQYRHIALSKSGYFRKYHTRSIRKQYLFCKSTYKIHAPFSELVPWWFAVYKLLFNICILYDRSCDKLRKHCYI